MEQSVSLPTINKNASVKGFSGHHYVCRLCIKEIQRCCYLSNHAGFVFKEIQGHCYLNECTQLN